MIYKFFMICIIGCLLVGGCTSATKPNQSVHTTAVTPTPLPVLHIKYFTTTNCPLCTETDNLTSDLSKKYPGRLIITRYDLSFNQSNRNVYFKYSGDLKFRLVPFMVVNEKTRFVNYSQIVNNLEPMITGEKNLT